MGTIIERQFLEYIFTEPVYCIKEQYFSQKEDKSRSVAPSKNVDLAKIEKGTLLWEKTQLGVWFIIKPINEDTVSKEELDLIHKTILALKLDINDVSLFVNQEIAHQGFKIENFESKKIILFGEITNLVTIEQLSVHKIVSIKNNQLIQTYSLQHLQENIELKKVWWNLMLQLFKN